jgi:hypothetical protein
LLLLKQISDKYGECRVCFLHLITLNHRPTFLVSPTTKDPVKRKGKTKIAL